MKTTTRYEPHDSRAFRDVLGRFPTGVVAITGLDEHGAPIGMIVGSFVSVSLSPPLVGFFPMASSKTFPKIQASGRFCVNVLSSDQVRVCSALANSSGDKFKDVEWVPREGTGCPQIVGSLAWIDCTIDTLAPAGDHLSVLGAVDCLEVADGSSSPMVFYQGGYGRFVGASVSAWDQPEFLAPLRLVATEHSALQDLAARYSMELLVLVESDGEMVVISSTGEALVDGLVTRVGSRVPIFPPMGGVFYAWSADGARRWAKLCAERGIPADSADAILARIRTAGWSLGLGTESSYLIDRISARIPAGVSKQDRRQALEAVASELEFESTDPQRHPEASETLVVRSVVMPVFTGGSEPAFFISMFGRQSMTGSELNELQSALAAVISRLREVDAS